MTLHFTGGFKTCVIGFFPTYTWWNGWIILEMNHYWKQQKKNSHEMLWALCLTFSSAFFWVFGKSLANAPPTEIKWRFCQWNKSSIAYIFISISTYLILLEVCSLPKLSEEKEKPPRAEQLLILKTQSRWVSKAPDHRRCSSRFAAVAVSEHHPRQSAWMHTTLECLDWLSLLKG